MNDQELQVTYYFSIGHPLDRTVPALSHPICIVKVQVGGDAGFSLCGG